MSSHSGLARARSVAMLTLISLGFVLVGLLSWPAATRSLPVVYVPAQTDGCGIAPAPTVSVLFHGHRSSIASDAAGQAAPATAIAVESNLSVSEAVRGR